MPEQELHVENMLKSCGTWLHGQGPESDIVISSRVRLARNLQGHMFNPRISFEESQTTRDEIAAVLKKGFRIPLDYISLPELSAIDRQFLVERHLISRELSKSSLSTGMAFNQDESVSIMVNEEDHIRLQTIASGLQLKECWALANEVDDWLEETLEYSFMMPFGYLTACPTNVGTGLRASMMLHLPALSMTKQIEKIYHALSKLNLVVRGLFGEGTSAMGDFYQISNQATLNASEENIVDTLLRIVPQVLEYERNIRDNLLTEQSSTLEDKLWRSLGILKYARKLKIEEALDCLSAVRLGINMGLIHDLDMSTVNDLFVLTQPAHLRLVNRMRDENVDIDTARADFVRAYLKPKPN